ncbi:disulfide bond formation protein B [Candidatus Woesebacteria bacterium]|nr:disulfide bond formation protein B [Candidatus Woesebacteria bacterium]
MQKQLIAKLAVYGAWLQALTALIVSLYFNEIMRLPACVLCWYQRIL